MRKKKEPVKSAEALELEQKMRDNISFYIEKDMSIPGWIEPEGNAQITLLFNENGMSIEVIDKSSGLPVFEIELDKDKTLQVLSRYARTYCNMKTYNLDKVGKQQKIAILYVNIGKPDHWNDKDLAAFEVTNNCPKGWTADMYFNSQDTFFQFEGNTWVKTTIRRWE